MDSLLFAFVTKIVVRADRAHVTNSYNRSYIATIALELVDLCLLILVLFRKILFIQASERIGTEGFDLLLNNFNQTTEAFEVELSSSITLAAWQTFIVDLGSFAFVAVDLLLNALFVTVFARD